MIRAILGLIFGAILGVVLGVVYGKMQGLSAMEVEPILLGTLAGGAVLGLLAGGLLFRKRT